MPKTVPCCPPFVLEPIDETDAHELATTLKALADPIRLRILSAIAAHPDGEACVCHLTAPSGLSQPTMSHHLKILHGAGLLGREKRGAWVYYRVVPERLEAIRASLATRPSPSRKAQRA